MGMWGKPAASVFLPTRVVVLITPESLEALLFHRGSEVRGLFGALEAVVVDELHAFIGNVRGRQLQSLLHRLECQLARRVQRIGLSATLGDMGLAADFLRPGQGPAVHGDVCRRKAAPAIGIEGGVPARHHD